MIRNIVEYLTFLAVCLLVCVGIDAVHQAAMVYLHLGPAMAAAWMVSGFSLLAAIPR